MSSFIWGSPSDSDDQFSLLNISSNFYDVDRRPFTFIGLKFEDLPQPTQEFLSHNTERLPSTVSKGDLDHYFHKLLAFRQEQQQRLERTLEGVHRAIVTAMLAARADPTNQHVLDRLRDVLVSEWRSHLDDYVDEINALIWFEMEMRKDTPLAMLPQQPFQERQEDVQRMVQFAIQCLQNVNEKVKREIMGEVVLQEQEQGQEQEQERRLLEQGHLSDASSSSSSTEEDLEEDLFSDEDNNVGSGSDDSESQWIDVESTFKRVAY
ncbi:hypothetical protein CPB84DRAFT_1796275 [Gymnopilus junonius]|uniref:Uncharacterized protein n=1 Tax=Gymnopilus junonius TaxID=109634 RepID=A0A9P5NAQ2_GYMJU|nr:hypothetical protein CPB84DRAFT_1796275 [Gymnopilus junonius]